MFSLKLGDRFTLRTLGVEMSLNAFHGIGHLHFVSFKLTGGGMGMLGGPATIRHVIADLPRTVALEH